MTLPIRSLDHTAIAVHRIEDALPLYRDLLGGDPQELYERPEHGFRALTLRYPGGGAIELIAPLGESGFVREFLDKRGEGVHHITFMVADLAAGVTEAREAGLRVVGEDYGDPAWQEAFISPAAPTGRSSNWPSPTSTWPPAAPTGRRMPTAWNAAAGRARRRARRPRTGRAPAADPARSSGCSGGRAGAQPGRPPARRGRSTAARG